MAAHDLLFDLIDDTGKGLSASEVVFGSLASEESDFVRFNRARVRQAMTIRQSYLTLSLVSGRRCDSATVSLSGSLEEDRSRVRGVLETMRGALPTLPEDPYLLYST